MSRFKSYLSILASAALFLGCSEAFEKTEMVPIEKVPEQVMKTAKENLPDVKFDSAWTEKDGSTIFYEVRGKSADGKTRDIRVTPEGKVLEID